MGNRVASKREILCTIGLGLLVSGALGCAAATAETAHTELRYMVAGVRVDPPEPGHNTVYVEFQDQTAQGGDFEDTVYHAVIQGIQDRGYIVTKDHKQANLVVWATLRIFTEAGNVEGDRALAALGAIAGGAGGAVVVHSAGGGKTATMVGAGGGAVSGWAITNIALKEHSYQMVIDLQLARKVEGGVQTESGGDAQSGLQQSTVAAGESGGSQMGQSKSQHLVEMKTHFEMEQRILAIASGRRLEQFVARDALVPKIISGLKSALPRAN